MKKYILSILCCFILSATIACIQQSQYRSISGTLSEKDREKLDQLIPPLKYKDTKSITIIQAIVNSANIPIKIRMCDRLLDQKVTIETYQPTKLRDVLEIIGSQLQCDFHLTTGLHGEIAKPIFDCKPFDSHTTEIHKE
jgi:hypothetical protein